MTTSAALPLATGPGDSRSAYRWLACAGASGALVCTLIGLAPANVCLAVGAAGCLLSRPRLPPLGGLWWVAGGFSLWCLLASTLASWGGANERPFESINAVYSWLAFPLGLVAFSSPVWRRRAVRWLMVASLAAFLLGLIQIGVGFDPDGVLRLGGEPFGRVGGFLNGPLKFGAVAALLLPLAFAERVRPFLTAKNAWTATLLASVFLSGTRLAIVGASAAIAVFVAAVGGPRRWRVALVLASLVLGVGVAAVAARDPERAARMLQGQDGRIGVWAASGHMVADRPLLGYGGRHGFRAAYGAYYQTWLDGQDQDPRKPMRRMPHAHNLLLILASEHGIPAVLLHLSVLGLILWHGWNARGRDPVAFARTAAVVAVWVTSGQFNNLSQGESAYAFWLALAWASVPLLMDGDDVDGRSSNPVAAGRVL